MAEILKQTSRDASATRAPRLAKARALVTAGDDRTADEVSKRRRRIARIAGAVASLVIFCLSLFVLARTLSTIRFADLRGAIAGTTASRSPARVCLQASPTSR